MTNADEPVDPLNETSYDSSLDIPGRSRRGLAVEIRTAIRKECNQRRPIGTHYVCSLSFNQE